MPDPRQRLADLLALAQSYRGWNRRQLAHALGRDPSKLLPDSGVPKLDLVVDLARALEWPIAQIARVLVDERVHAFGVAAPPPAFPPDGADLRFDALVERLDAAEAAGDLEAAYRAGRRALVVAGPGAGTTLYFRLARLREREGYYHDAIDLVRRGLREQPAADERRRLLLALARNHYAAANDREAFGVASLLLGDERPPAVDDAPAVEAAALRGNAARRLLRRGSRSGPQLDNAQRDLRCAETHGGADDDLVGATICRGAQLELDLVHRAGDLRSGLRRVEAFLDAPTSAASAGWWCVFAGNAVAARRTRHRAAEEYARRALELGRTTSNWALFARALDHGVRLEIDIRTFLPKAADVLDAMMRLPGFHATGWRLLEAELAERDRKPAAVRRARPSPSPLSRPGPDPGTGCPQ